MFFSSEHIDTSPRLSKDLRMFLSNCSYFFDGAFFSLGLQTKRGNSFTGLSILLETESSETYVEHLVRVFFSAVFYDGPSSYGIST